MGNQVDKKFTWVIKNFSALEPDKKNYSDQFVVGGCKWRLIVYPKGKNVECLALFLEVADYGSLPSGWRRCANLRLSIYLYEYLKFQVPAAQHWFDEKSVNWGVLGMLPLTKLHENNGGFLMNGEVKIVAEVDVLEVIDKSDVSKEAEDATQPLKKLKVNDDNAVSSDLLNKTQQLNETVDVNGFQVLPSQVGSVKRILERYPDIASEVRPKNRFLRTTYMYVILGVINTLCQLPEEISDDDLEEASFAVSYAAKGRFKVDWLEKKVEEVKEKKKKVDTGKARLQQIEEEFQKLHRKCLDLKDILEKEYADVSVANVPLSFDDVVDVLKF